jgi:ribonuclease J
VSAKDRLIYLPLGGAGEIGMNTYVYGWGRPGAERLIVVDLGVTFPDMERSPGVDLIMADIAWLEERAERIEAIFITHAHEDHVGALGHLWPRLQAPVHARPFTAEIARQKLEKSGLDRRNVKEAKPWPHMVKAGPFRVGFAPISHSIPESSALVIDTPAGRIVHSADFKIDHSPVVGEAFSEDLYREIAGPGVKALMCDSTNVFSLHEGRSESAIRKPIADLVRAQKGMVVATTFASNIARLKTLAQAGVDAGRSVVIVGRALQTMLKAGFSSGVLKDFPPFVEAEDSVEIPRGDMMVLASGSQGERRAASAQLARERFMHIEMKPGDLFLFSSKTIPGNEKAVAWIHNQLAELGVNVIEGDDRFHVSGHANRPDLQAFHALIRPRTLVPMHGEYRHLKLHAEVAREGGFGALIAGNGTMLDLTGEEPVVAEAVETGRLYLDGSVLISAMDGVVRDRLRLAQRGHVTVSVMLDSKNRPLGGVWADCLGLPEPEGVDGGLQGALERFVDSDLAEAKPKVLASDEALEALVVRAVSSGASDLTGKKPVVSVMISRLD